MRKNLGISRSIIYFVIGDIMPFSGFFYPVVISIVKIVASSVAGEFAKSAGKATADTVKKRLREKRSGNGAGLQNKAVDTANYEILIRKQLDAAYLASDPELKQLAGVIISAIDAMPIDARPNVAIDVMVTAGKGDYVTAGGEYSKGRVVG